MNSYLISAPIGIYGCRVEMAAGETMPVHSHPYEHSLDVRAGSINVVIDGKESLQPGGTRVVFPARSSHSFTAMEDGTVLDVWHAEALMQAAIASGEGVTQHQALRATADGAVVEVLF